jgi:hypothetical protein
MIHRSLVVDLEFEVGRGDGMIVISTWAVGFRSGWDDVESEE